MTRKDLRRNIETILVRGLMNLFGAMPLDTASWLGGKIGEVIGPLTGIDRKARRQMADIFPAMPPADLDTNICQMWNNLGRVMAEYPHLPRIMHERIVIDDQAGIAQNPHFTTSPAIFISGHFANWEVAGPSLLKLTGEKLNLVYRAANNPGVDALLGYYRSMDGTLDMIAKSRTGARAIVEYLEGNKKIGILIDQKYTEGIVTNFFGRPATATTIYAQLGQRFGCPVYPAQVVRMGGAHFKITLYPALKLYNAQGAPRSLEDVVGDVHNMMFDWLRAHPDQWLWVHQRWSSPRLRSHPSATAQAA